MGGNAFKTATRINKCDIEPTLKHVAYVIDCNTLNYNYICNNLMGSTGKKPTSGDIDIAVNTYNVYVPFSNNQYDVRFTSEILPKLNKRLRKKLGDHCVVSKGMNGGQLQSLFPIRGDIKYGEVQVDFIAGNSEWLKFSHWSSEESDYKGVFLSTLHGVIAKMNKDFDFYNLDGSRYCRVGLMLDLELGLYRSWQYQKKKGHGVSRVSADDWETNVKLPNGLVPRFIRTGYITNPDTVCNILYGTTFENVNSFEKAWKVAAVKYADRIDELKERIFDALSRCAAKNDYESTDAMRKHLDKVIG